MAFKVLKPSRKKGARKISISPVNKSVKFSSALCDVLGLDDNNANFVRLAWDDEDRLLATQFLDHEIKNETKRIYWIKNRKGERISFSFSIASFLNELSIDGIKEISGNFYEEAISKPKEVEGLDGKWIVLDINKRTTTSKKSAR